MIASGVFAVICYVVDHAVFANYLQIHHVPHAGELSVLCGALFYGWGFGLYDRLPPSQGVVVAIAIYSAQVIFSRLWLARFAQGPLEWLWRRASYADSPA